jgi:hypothetical protein
MNIFNKCSLSVILKKLYLNSNNYLLKNKFILLSLFSLFLLLIVFNFGIFQMPVNFDGAMNLQISKALKNGTGYYREYREKIFPYEIQTGPGLILPGYLFFKILGITYFSSQIVNVIYYFCLLIVSFNVLLEKNKNLITVFITFLTIPFTPNIFSFAFGGFGETISLFWWLLGIFLLSDKNLFLHFNFKKIFLAGACFGISFITKYVIMVCILPSFILIFTFLVSRNIKYKFKIFTYLMYGLLTPIFLFELYKLYSLGNFHQYVEWTIFSFSAVKQMAIDPNYSFLHTLFSRIGRFSSYFGLPIITTLTLISTLALFGAYKTFIFIKSGRIQMYISVEIFLFLGGFAYFIWWLLIAPEVAASERRIFNGFFIAYLFLLIAFFDFYKSSKKVNNFVSYILLFNVFLIGAIGIKLYLDKRMDYPGGSNFRGAVDYIKNIPKECTIFGSDWYSSPALALYSGRHVSDVNRYPQMSRENLLCTYFLSDTACQGNKDCGLEILSKYKHEIVFNGDNKIYQIDFKKQNQDLKNISSEHIKNNQNFNPKDWVDSDVNFSIYKNKNILFYDIFLPSSLHYVNSKTKIMVKVNNMLCGEIILNDGKNVGNFNMFESCKEIKGYVNVRLISDNVLDSNLMDWRELSYILNNFSFVSNLE